MLEFHQWLIRTGQMPDTRHCADRDRIFEPLQERFEDWENKTTREPQLRHWMAFDVQSDRDNYTAGLFRLIRKADPSNLQRLRLAYPDQCYCVLLWERINSTDPRA